MVKNHTRYIFSMGELKRKDNSIMFKNEKGNFYIPIIDTKELYCMNEVSFNTKFLDFISKAGIVLHIFNYHEGYSGTFYPKEQLVSGDLVIKQVNCFLTNRLEISKSIVLGMANNIYEILYHYYRHDKTKIKPTLDYLRKVEKLLNKEININQIMFIEGQIWMRFYDSFKYFLPSDFIMNKRVKRPPDNPINALISFGNTLLYTKTIFELVNRRKIQLKHFEKKFNYALLNEEGKKIFIDAFENRLNETFLHPKLKRKTTLKHCLKLEGYKLIKTIIEDKKFNPFNIKDKF